MGSFDCYCALCAGPLGAGYLRFGDAKAKALKKRNKRVELKKMSLAAGEEEVDLDEIAVSDDEVMADNNEKIGEGSQEGGQEHNNPDDDEADDDNYEDVSDSDSWTSGDDSMAGSGDGSDSGMGVYNVHDVDVPPEPERQGTFSQTSDLDWEGEGLRNYHGEPEDHSMYDYMEQASYDPTLLQDDDVRWIDRCRVLAINDAAPGVKKVFMSGRGRYDDYGSFSIRKRGKDPRDTGMNDHSCFETYDADIPPAYPFHEACFQVLTRRLGYENPNEVDKDVLYTVMTQFCADYARMLALDYGSEQECGQFWECMPGEEVSPSLLSNNIEKLTNLGSTQSATQAQSPALMKFFGVCFPLNYSIVLNRTWSYRIKFATTL